MRTPFAVAFMLTIMLAGTYWVSGVWAVCKVPIEWRIGELDERFGLSESDARTYVEEAASLWEDATDRNLFTYNEDSDFVINFIYDERQAEADAAEELKEELDEKEGVNEELNQTYAELVAQYNARQIAFEDTKSVYQRRLNTYNQTVARYNADGGAPAGEYERLQQEAAALDKQRIAINSEAEKLNEFADQINALGEKGNELVQTYNEEVGQYNERFGHDEAFTQGDYQGADINIYKFSDEAELTIVLTHELGHALSLDHVENEASIMYYLMGKQSRDPFKLTAEDVAAFSETCGQQSVIDRLRAAISELLTRGV